MIPTFLAPAWQSIAPALKNHLWQSTIFALVAALLALVLRSNRARERYWLWMAASLKFLLPFALLAGIGGHFARPRAAVVAQPTVYSAMENFSEPFTLQATPIIAPAASQVESIAWPSLLPMLCGMMWLAGFGFVLGMWCVRWRRVAKSMRRAVPLTSGREFDLLCQIEQAAGLRSRNRIDLRLSTDSMEPGVFGGIWSGIFGTGAASSGIARPVLAWPAGISQRLDDAQLEAILAHEVCHVRRRDNLTAAIHMLVEAVFWFHPLVWWLGARLIEERERACDEEVLRRCNRPELYAESILKVCEFCLESPLPCVSGVTGSDLKKRIVNILAGRIALKLGTGRKLLLLATALLVVAVPILLGQARAAQRMALAAPAVLAQASAPSVSATPATPTSSATAPTLPAAAAAAPASPAVVPGVIPPNLLTIADIAAATEITPAISFDVVSIKVNKSDAPMRALEDPTDGDGITLENLTLFDIMRWNFNIHSFREDQLVGVPKWFTTERFDIQAKVAGDDVPAWRKLTEAQRRLVFRKVLVDRFKLAAHWTNVEGSVYYLVVSKGGLKIKSVKAGDPDPDAPKGPDGTPFKGSGIFMIDRTPSDQKFVFQQISLSWLAKEFLSNYAGKQAYDKTGLPLDTIYNFTLQFAPDRATAPVMPGTDSGEASAPMPDSGPSIFTALQEQLGMKLDPGKGPVGRLIIDHVEQPTPD